MYTVFSALFLTVLCYTGYELMGCRGKPVGLIFRVKGILNIILADDSAIKCNEVMHELELYLQGEKKKEREHLVPPSVLVFVQGSNF